MMYLNSNDKGSTAFNELKNIATGSKVTLAEFRASHDVSLMQIAFGLDNPALWGTAGGLQMDILVDGTSFVTMKSEFSDLKNPATIFATIKAKQNIKVELANNSGSTINDAAIKVDVIV